MRAVLLAAGLGSRLAPIVHDVPKPMVPIDGMPIIESNVRFLVAHGVRDLVVNLHHLPDVIVGHLGDGSWLGAEISYAPEPDLLGTAGTIGALADQLDETFLVLYADN